LDAARVSGTLSWNGKPFPRLKQAMNTCIADCGDMPMVRVSRSNFRFSAAPSRVAMIAVPLSLLVPN
jgi:hypothetical protein